MIPCPERILEIRDNGGETADRYTIVFRKLDPREPRRYHDMLGLSSYPSHPQGFSQWCEGVPGNHLGKRILWEDLPEEIQRHVACRIEER